MKLRPKVENKQPSLVSDSGTQSRGDVGQVDILKTPGGPIVDIRSPNVAGDFGRKARLALAQETKNIGMRAFPDLVPRDLVGVGEAVQARDIQEEGTSGCGLSHHSSGKGRQ